MGKKAFLFPGQGSQEIGMGQDLFNEDPFFCSLVSTASDMVHEDLKKICLRGPERKLVLARYLQPLLVAVSLGYLKKLTERGVTPDYVLGHSLGEITSLAASGTVSFEDAVKIAAKRGELMDRVAAQNSGGMMAVLFAKMETVENVLEEINEPKRLVLANDNASEQIVISGDNELMDKFAKIINDRQLGKCKKVNVSGPWHSPYLYDSRIEFENWAENVKFNEPHTPIVLNAIAKSDKHPTTIKHLVTWQLTSPVFWRESMGFLLDAGVESLYEIGPGRVLSGLARVNGFKKNARIHNVNNFRGVEMAVTENSCAIG